MCKTFFFKKNTVATAATDSRETITTSTLGLNKIMNAVLLLTVGLLACQFVQNGVKVAAEIVSPNAPLPSSYINIKPSRNYLEYEKLKRSVSQPANVPHKIPSLESLFQVVTFWDNLNQSSPCPYHGKKRTQLCHKRVLFDKVGYEKSLQDTKQLILNRLNLKQEPNINMNKNMLEFIEQIENKNHETDEYNEYDHSDADDSENEYNSMVKTKYDMKSSSDDKYITSMHDAVDVNRCSNRLQSMLDMSLLSESLQLEYDIMPLLANSICLRFKMPVKNFIKELNSKGAVDIRKIKSALLWLYIKTKPNNWKESDESSTDYTPQYDRRQDDLLSLKITNLNDPDKYMILKQSKMVDDWNTVDITNVLKSTIYKTLNHYKKNKKLKQEEYINLSLMIKCAKNCTIGFARPTESPANVGPLLSTEYQSDADFVESLYPNDVTIGFKAPKKPLLSVSIYENRVLHDASSHLRGIDGERNSKRTKRRVQHLEQNYRAHGIDKDTYTPKQCFNNYPDSNRECCLITYYVNFNSLKWSSWILSPSGFFANYCSGKCHDIKSFKYAGHNAEIKIQYNENLLGKDHADANEILETCCHPISMDSLVIKYLANNGSVINTVIPNMIITGCGCS